MLFQRFCPAFYFPLGKILFNPAVFIKNLVIVFCLIDLVEAESVGGAGKMPSFRIQRKLLKVLRKLLYRLGCDKAADLYTVNRFIVKLPVCL